jgi:hypothetical protein
VLVSYDGEFPTLPNLTNGDVVVVVDGNQVAELQVTGHGGGLGGNTLHGTAITEEGVGVVVEQLKAGLVEDTTGVGLGNGQTDGVGETLTQRTSGDLDTGGVVSLGVTGGDAVELLLGFKSVWVCYVWHRATLRGQCFVAVLTRKFFRSSIVRA